MEKLTKPFVVIYDSKTKQISFQTSKNSETIVGKGLKGKEFETEQEMKDFISENKLINENKA